ncbi:MAG: FAD-binding protein, partial [Litorilinea sp.]
MSAQAGTTQHHVAQAAIRPQSVEDVISAIGEHPKLRPVGGCTKPALALPPAPIPQLDMTALAGVVEYDPGEYTITVQAGTRLETIRAILAENGQHMPFDPPWVDAGATIGGTIAAGVSGAGRHRFGSLRDFLIGVRFVDGQARLIRGGGKVVKNAAGFDLPKLLVGSRGEFGILVEASLKVFPEPPAYGTLTQSLDSFDAAQALIARLARSTFDLYALDLHCTGESPHAYTLRARLGGLAATIEPRLNQLRTYLGGGDLLAKPTTEPIEEAEIWHAARELTWTPPDGWLVKCAMTHATALQLEAALSQLSYITARRYTNALNSVWLAGTGDLQALAAALTQAGISGLLLRAPAG